MQEERPEITTGITPEKKDAERDATSKETVSDLSESEKTSVEESGDSSSSGAGSSSGPSPDGQFDEPSTATGSGNEAGPM